VRLLSVTAKPPPVGQPVPGAVDRAAFGPDGRLAAAAVDRDEVAGIALWDLGAGETPDLSAPGSYGSTNLSPDGTLLATVTNIQNEGTLTGEVELWDVAIGRRTAGPLDAPSETGAGPGLVSPDNARLVVAGGDKVWVWTLRTEPSLEVAFELPGVTDIDIDASGQFLVAGSCGDSEAPDNPTVLPL
jgi:WD40 repeat protein